MMFSSLVDNLMHPPVLFFFLGVAAVLVRSDLEIPPAIGKFLSIYLLFDIGIRGGEELYHHGFHLGIMKILLVCMVASFVIPFVVYRILRLRLGVHNAGAIAAAYGSISAVTFATAISFLESQHVAFGGYMVAGMALMESPAIVAGLLLVKSALRNDGEDGQGSEDGNDSKGSGHGLRRILHESAFNGSVFLLVGSLIIGVLSGPTGEAELRPFVTEIFAGMLSLYMLDMGILAGRRLGSLRQAGRFLTGFALTFPPIVGSIAIAIAYAMGLSRGDALLFTVLCASASYIAVPAAMRIAVPKANMSLLLPMSLGITFTLNVTLGIPAYYFVIGRLWV